MNNVIDPDSLLNIRTISADINGQARGKLVPPSKLESINKSGIRCPFSALNLDIWGEDIEDSPLVFESGDSDGVLYPTSRGLLPVPWIDTPTAMLPLWMFDDHNQVFGGDPRHALSSILARYTKLGLTPVVAIEMEFYLLDPATINVDGKGLSAMPHQEGGEVLSIRELELFEPFLADLQRGCRALDIPYESITSEAGTGQFELVLSHAPDALRIADNAWFFSQMTRGLAHKHNMLATFAAKPVPDQPGTGMHVHFSVLDNQGRNIFNNDDALGTDTMRHAIAGCLDGMSELSLMFAPHQNSYERMVPNSHAPTGICWAYENRTASIRVPGGPPAATRIEHRVAGGDVNPYLAMASILGSALLGIENKRLPLAPITGNAYEQPLEQLATNWQKAISQFEQSPIAKAIFDPLLISNIVMTKQQELKRMQNLSPKDALSVYLQKI